MVQVTCKYAFTLMDENISAIPGQHVEVPESKVQSLLESDLIFPPNEEVEDTKELEEDGTDD